MDKFHAYQELLANIPRNFIPKKHSSTSALEKILPKATRSCAGKVLYSVHRLEKNKIRYLWCGPEDLQVFRHDTKEMSSNEGCMGRTIELGVPYKIWNNVGSTVESKGVFVNAAPEHTKSELVVVMPSAAHSSGLEILNLESDELDAFDEIDAQAFWAIGIWASLLRVAHEGLEDQREMLKEVSRILGGPSILTKDAEPVTSSEIRPSLVQALRRSIPFDALSVVSFTPQELQGVLNVDYHYGINPKALVSNRFEEDWDSFSATVLKERGIVTVSGDERVARLRVYRPETTAAIGAPLDAQAPAGRRSALVLEFDESREFSEREQRATEELATLVGHLISQQRRVKSGAALNRTLEALPRLALLGKKHESYSALLEKATEILAKSLRASGCGFFEEIEDSAGAKSVQKVAFFLGRDSSVERDAYWVRYLNENWVGDPRLRRAFDEGSTVEYSLSVNPSVPFGPSNYRFFAMPVDLMGRKLLLVSFKAIDQSRVLSLEMSSTSLLILRAVLESLRTRIAGMRSEEKRRMMKAGLGMAIQMAFSVDTGRKRSRSDRIEALFGRVHRFLGQWSEVADARYAAIFLCDIEASTLELSEASMRWLLEMASSQGREVDPGLERPGLPLATPGLTVSVFQTGRSKFSLEVSSEGSSKCKSFWKKITGRSAKHRFFAGAQIPNPDGEPFGVLTLNGVPRVHFGDLRAEWEWRLLPVLETVAAELGQAFSSIQAESSSLKS